MARLKNSLSAELSAELPGTLARDVFGNGVIAMVVLLDLVRLTTPGKPLLPGHLEKAGCRLLG